MTHSRSFSPGGAPPHFLRGNVTRTGCRYRPERWGSPRLRKVVTVGIKQYKPTSPGRRFQTVSDFSEITTSKPEKSLLAPKPKKAGRNCYGRITTRHQGGGNKQRYQELFRQAANRHISRTLRLVTGIGDLTTFADAAFATVGLGRLAGSAPVGNRLATTVGEVPVCGEARERKLQRKGANVSRWLPLPAGERVLFDSHSNNLS